ncbi:multidrug resistance-associated ABC transporter [Calocera viscosa TUFC12733]|uniref:Multidrug resistance-associated ABC transporter n=1 Tax=Calocera viscosa (strain TUFC12733) TaxID=1330018 RepID=A0A167P0X3_CALVF|nr:multidrug resistance-associated ABC transporter [Calocera viscosa TUFC12733]
MSPSSPSTEQGHEDVDSNLKPQQEKKKKRNFLARLYRPDPAPPAFGKGTIVPDIRSNILSRVTVQWLTPLLYVGYTRPIEEEDLWELDDARLAHTVADTLEGNFYARVPPHKRPPFLRPSASDQAGPGQGEKIVHTPTTTSTASASASAVPPDLEKGPAPPGSSSGPGPGPEKLSRAKSGVSYLSAKAGRAPKPKTYDSSLILALNRTFFWRFWPAGILKLIGDTLNTTTPLVSKALITYLTEAYVYYQDPAAPPPRSVGYGVGLAVALFVMQETSSICQNNYMQWSMQTGFLIRTSVISNIFRKALRLSGKARLTHSTGQITTMISADATRMDLASGFAHMLWVSPIQILIGIALLIANLGYSALVGLGVLIIGFPLQGYLVRMIFTARRRAVMLTDQRVRLMQEILAGIRVIKLYVWELFYGRKIGEIREKELRNIRTMALSRAFMASVVAFIPIAASILSFITYALSNHPLEPAIIFSSLQYFNIIRAPLIYLPLVFTACTDAYIALGRIGKMMVASEIEEPYTVDPDAPLAVSAEGDFVWESVERPDQNAKEFASWRSGGRGGRGGARGRGGGHAGAGAGSREETKKKKAEEKKKKAEEKKREKENKEREKKGLPPLEEEEKEDQDPNGRKPFALKDIDLKVPRGSFIAIVGKVGSGKSSLLQALIGEMRRTRGQIVYGGSTAYVPQAAWIINATLRDNVTFGKPDDPDKFDAICQACALTPDLDMLPNGDMTEIGEKGINLSGGQKARVSLARATYSDADIVLLDDPLSAVDAHVANHILENCLLRGPLADKTRILVTHALYVLPHVDYILVMDEGKITESGTYEELLSNGQAFSELIEEFGSQQQTKAPEEEDEKKVVKPGDAKLAEKGPKLMMEEDRETGQVATKVYTEWLLAAGSIWWAPGILLIIALGQAASVGNNLFLGFWTNNSFSNFSQSGYMGLYAGLGGLQALFAFMGAFGFSLASIAASRTLYAKALITVFRAPVWFYDTTPLGRIVNRLAKDVDVMDNQLAQAFYQLLTTFASVVGTVFLVFYTYAYLGIIFIPLLVLYWAASTFYRRTSVEVKRMDSVLRSNLYAAYQETLTGLATVRAYRVQQRFVTTTEHYIDVENRAYFMTITLQRWLGMRLDFLGNLLILGIGLFSVGFRNTVDPSKAGVVLSYTLSITQVFSQMVTQFAQTEQNMNAVERVEHYTKLEQEPSETTPKDPPPTWPSQGQISFKNVQMRYREGLPLVLKGISFDVKPGEKVGVVGRTGAGKTSVLQALFRMVEICGGEILVDGVNINEIGLSVLRKQLAIIPQDALLFQGTLRTNLDPTQSRTDAELMSALQRAWLLPPAGQSDPIAEAKFNLDGAVTDEGANFSAGERQLVALCRALVKDSKIIVLDEATSSVDVGTDSKIQMTIQQEFVSSTLLCIAHRLNTIVYYDRVLVLDDGQIAEFDTPLNLFDNPDSIFRSMCEKAGLSRRDIERIRAGVASQLPSQIPTLVAPTPETASLAPPANEREADAAITEMDASRTMDADTALVVDDMARAGPADGLQVEQAVEALGALRTEMDREE